MFVFNKKSKKKFNWKPPSAGGLSIKSSAVYEDGATSAIRTTSGTLMAHRFPRVL